MKKRILLLPLFAVLMLLLPSCEVDYWNPEPPNGWNDIRYDQRLNGCWQLYQVNSDYVSGDQINYMQFYGNGRGMYFYYDRGYQYTEKMAYWCQPAVSGNTTWQINVQYEYGSPSTMNYWFTDAYTLWMQWRNSYGLQTYVYKYTNHVPW